MKRIAEAEWLSCKNPTLIWDYLYKKKGNIRKLQLAACACCRRIWHLLPEKYRHLVELSEQAADGLVTEEQLDEAWKHEEDELWVWNPEAKAVIAATGVMAGIRAEYAFESAQGHAAVAATGQHCAYDELDPTIPAVAAELEALTKLLRCIVGNPFRAVTLHPTWFAWNAGTIPKLAQAIYDESAFDRMPMLADALEEAGCSDPDILNHCRYPGTHVRGCWVVDLILGKE